MNNRTIYTFCHKRYYCVIKVCKLPVMKFKYFIWQILYKSDTVCFFMDFVRCGNGILFFHGFNAPLLAAFRRRKPKGSVFCMMINSNYSVPLKCPNFCKTEKINILFHTKSLLPVNKHRKIFGLFYPWWITFCISKIYLPKSFFWEKFEFICHH